MKIGAFAIALAAVVLLAASAFAWSRHGGAQARTGSDVLLALTPPSVDATQAPEATPSEAAPLEHRSSVLQEFSCFDCHGIDRGFLMPGDHATMAEAECTNCHRPVPAPPPISLHDDTHQQSPSAECGSCHTQFAVQRRPATITQGVCFACHGSETDKVFPASHAGRSNSTATCIVCHQTQQISIPAVPHRTAGFEECTFCHGPQRLTPLDGAHASQPTDRCLTCHTVVEPPPIYAEMHTLATEKQGCTSCHAPAGIAPLAASHDGRSELLCVLCHQPATADDEPPEVPHSITSGSACLSCHASGQLGGLPWDHATRSDQTCAICHAEKPGGAPPIPHALENRAVCTECHAPSVQPASTRS